jgi:hypothetical protein
MLVAGADFAPSGWPRQCRKDVEENERKIWIMLSDGVG